MTGTGLLVPVFVMAAILYGTRLLPFLFFKGGRPPPMLAYLERSIPPLIMLLLVIYCLKDVEWLKRPHGMPEITAIVLVVATHLWRKNALLSITAGTVLYMLAIRL